MSAYRGLFSCVPPRKNPSEVWESGVGDQPTEMGNYHFHLKKHPSLHYHKTYSSHKEAMDCWHVQTAAKHHNIHLMTLVRALVSGISLLSAISQIVSVALVL